MIVDLPDTTTSAVSKTLVKIREEGGAVALGRVLTLVIATRLGDEEEAIEAANDASREHPMRVIVVSTIDRRRRRGRADSTPRSASAATPARARSSCSGPTATPPATRRASSRPAAARRPRRRLVAQDAPQRRLASPRSAASPSGASPMPPQSQPASVARRPRPTTTLPATPTSRGPGSPCGAPSSPRCSTSRRTSRSPGSGVSGASDSPSTVLLAAWLQLQLAGARRRSSSRPGRRDRAASTVSGSTARPGPSSSSVRWSTSRR